MLHFPFITFYFLSFLHYLLAPLLPSTLLYSPLLLHPSLPTTPPPFSYFLTPSFHLSAFIFIFSFCISLHLIYLHVPEIELVDPDRNLLIVPSEDTEADEDTEGKTGPPPADGI